MTGGSNKTKDATVALTQVDDTALLSYLDSLLRQATEPEVEAAPPPEPVDEPSTLNLISLDPEKPITTLKDFNELTAGSTGTDALVWQNGRPVWAASRFEVLLFEMQGLKFAAPLIELGLIHAIDKPLTQMAGHPGWVAGILPLHGKSILVVDTLKALMPEKSRQSAASDYKYVITINGCAWGLACSKLLKAQSMQPEQVKWRQLSGSRAWLVGTVLDEMCSMVDVATLARGFERLKSPN